MSKIRCGRTAVTAARWHSEEDLQMQHSDYPPDDLIAGMQQSSDRTGQVPQNGTDNPPARRVLLASAIEEEFVGQTRRAPREVEIGRSSGISFGVSGDEDIVELAIATASEDGLTQLSLFLDLEHASGLAEELTAAVDLLASVGEARCSAPAAVALITASALGAIVGSASAAVNAERRAARTHHASRHAHHKPGHARRVRAASSGWDAT
jgi:hypothetical protein